MITTPTARNQEASFEHKFLFARCDHAFIVSLLKYSLRPDPEFKQGRVSSIYFDTPTLDLYHEKRASTYLKTKVRLRWYGDASKLAGAVPCYLEVKSKTGVTRHKQRIGVPVPAAVLTDNDIGRREIADMPQRLATLGQSIDGALVPMLTVQYERQRFVDSGTGVRVAIDTDICCPAVNRRFIPAVPPAHVPACVLEIKGSERELPAWFKPLRQHLRKDAFSKYSTCFEHLLQPAGRRE